MKVYLLPLLLLMVSCVSKTTDNATENLVDSLDEISDVIEVSDTLPPFSIIKSKSGGYDMWTISENPRKVSGLPYEDCIAPGICDYSGEIELGKPLYYKDATWSAMVRALKNLTPYPASKIIFNYAKTERQMNDENTCLYVGECEIKGPRGKYVEALFNITVRWAVPNDYTQATGWYCKGNIVF